MSVNKNHIKLNKNLYPVGYIFLSAYFIQNGGKRVLSCQ